MATARQGAVVRGTMKWAVYDGGNGDVVAAAAGFAIRVVQLALTLDAAGTAYFKDGTGGTALTPVWHFVDTNGVSLILPYSPFGWFQTAVADKLSIVIATATDAAVLVGYVQVETSAAA